MKKPGEHSHQTPLTDVAPDLAPGQKPLTTDDV